MSGRNKEAENSQAALARSQMDIFKSMQQESNKRTAQMDALQKPLVDYSTAMASGDMSKMLIAAAPQLSQLTAAQKATQENIFDQVPRGPARDFALAQSKRDAPNQSAALMNNSFMQALSTLGQLGSEQGNYGLQELGAGLRAGESAGQTNNALMQNANARKATQLGALSSLAGIAGSAVTGGFGGGGGASGSAFTSLPYANPAASMSLNRNMTPTANLFSGTGY